MSNQDDLISFDFPSEAAVPVAADGQPAAATPASAKKSPAPDVEASPVASPAAASPLSDKALPFSPAKEEKAAAATASPNKVAATPSVSLASPAAPAVATPSTLGLSALVATPTTAPDQASLTVVTAASPPAASSSSGSPTHKAPLASPVPDALTPTTFGLSSLMASPKSPFSPVVSPTNAAATAKYPADASASASTPSSGSGGRGSVSPLQLVSPVASSKASPTVQAASTPASAKASASVASSPAASSPSVVTPSSSSSSASSASSSSSSPVAPLSLSISSPASSPRSAGIPGSGPRSKSPLPARPASASSPRQRQSAAALAAEGLGLASPRSPRSPRSAGSSSCMSPTASSALRAATTASPPASPKANQAAASQSSSSSAAAASSHPHAHGNGVLDFGELRGIKEEEPEEVEGELAASRSARKDSTTGMDLDSILAHRMAQRLVAAAVAAGAASAASSSFSSSSHQQQPQQAAKEPAATATAASKSPAAAAAAAEKKAGGRASPVFDRLYEIKPKEDGTFLTAEHTFRPQRVTEAPGNRELYPQPERKPGRKGEIFERLYQEKDDRDEYYRRAEEVRQQLEVAECVFKPQLITREFNDEHVPPPESSVFDRLYNGLEERKEYYRIAEEVKEARELQDCTFVPATLEAGAPPAAEGEEAPNVWERLFYVKTQELEEKKARQALEAEERLRATHTFRPLLVAKATSLAGAGATMEATGGGGGSGGAHDRLFQEAKGRKMRVEERLRQAPHGCTFRPQRVAKGKDPLHPAQGMQRAQEMYIRGREKVARNLEKEMARKPPKPRSDEEECTFWPQTNWSKK